MPQQQKVSTENNFVKGLITDFTALNFPENAATDTDNCIYDFEGDVTRRPGFDLELNYDTYSIPEADVGATLGYMWRNAGGDGNTNIFVVQVGAHLHFYRATDATVTDPLSTTKLDSIIDLADFAVSGGTDTGCQFSDGNGYLFVYSTACDPFYCTYDSLGTVTGTRINLKIRDFKGIPDGEGVGGIGDIKERPTTLTDLHKYNLLNQGWTEGQRWTATFDYSGDAGVGYLPLSWTGNGARAFGPHQAGGSGLNDYDNSLAHHTWTVPAGLPAFVGQQLQFSYVVGVTVYNIDDVEFEPGNASGTGTATVLSYSGTTMEVLINSVNPYVHDDRIEVEFATSPFRYNVRTADSENTIDVFFSQCGIYPSNTDVWFTFKEVEALNTAAGFGGSVGVEKFAPGKTISVIVQPVSQAPAGHFILDAFDQDRATASGIGGLTSVTTDARPRTGAWFQGRVWYAGIDASQDATGDQPFYTWTENLYFSQIIEDSSGQQFGKCYQFDDPTDENNFNLLPTDGGVITIQGCGSIFKLFPIQNGMLVFAANGIWFITGSSGIGFNATDYTITKISAVRSISGNSYVDVNGLPYFWNEEAIYAVMPAEKGSGLSVEPITVHAISRYYEDIPYQDKVDARGAYDPINYVVQWVHGTGRTTIDPDTGGGSTEPLTMWLFEECCHGYRSDDSTGLSFTEVHTPEGAADGSILPEGTAYHDTNEDTWIWQSLGYMDQDYDNVFSLDQGYFSSLGGAVALNPNKGTHGSWQLRDIGNHIPSGLGQALFHRSATHSPNTGVYMAGPMDEQFASASLQGSYLWLSSDHGVTWGETGHEVGRAFWRNMAITPNANIIYAQGGDPATVNDPFTQTHCLTSMVVRSVDRGVNWTRLTDIDEPVRASWFSFNLESLATSVDGRTLLFVNGIAPVETMTTSGHVWVSRDSGSTWNMVPYSDAGIEGVYGTGMSYTSLPPNTGTNGAVSADGTKMFVWNTSNPPSSMVDLAVDASYDPFWTVDVVLWYSKDSGQTWKPIVEPFGRATPAPGSWAEEFVASPDWGGIGSSGADYMALTYFNLWPDRVNVSQDGSSLMCVTQSVDGYVFVVSTDEGATWTLYECFPNYSEDPADGFSGGARTLNFDNPSFFNADNFDHFDIVSSWLVDENFDTSSVGQVTNEHAATNNILNYNTLTKAWYPWTATHEAGDPTIYDVKYIQNPGAETDSPDGVFKYVTLVPDDPDVPTTEDLTFSECYDTTYVDWDFDGTGTNYESYFLTGYKLHGSAIRKWQPEYLQMYSRNDTNSKYHIQGVFGFGSDPASGRWSNKQLISIQDKTNFGMWTNKIRLRGSGLVTQIRVSSLDDNPFDIMGWAIMENQNPNV